VLSSAPHVQANLAPVVPPITSTDGVHFARRPLPEERQALLAYLRRLQAQPVRPLFERRGILRNDLSLG